MHICGQVEHIPITVLIIIVLKDPILSQTQSKGLIEIKPWSMYADDPMTRLLVTLQSGIAGRLPINEWVVVCQYSMGEHLLGYSSLPFLPASFMF